LLEFPHNLVEKVLDKAQIDKIDKAQIDKIDNLPIQFSPKENNTKVII
jgi:hypothetical protein